MSRVRPRSRDWQGGERPWLYVTWPLISVTGPRLFSLEVRQGSKQVEADRLQGRTSSSRYFTGLVLVKLVQDTTTDTFACTQCYHCTGATAALKTHMQRKHRRLSAYNISQCLGQLFFLCFASKSKVIRLFIRLSRRQQEVFLKLDQPLALQAFCVVLVK